MDIALKTMLERQIENAIAQEETVATKARLLKVHRKGRGQKKRKGPKAH